MTVIAAKIVISLICIFSYILLCRDGRLFSCASIQFSFLVLSLLLISRLTTFLVVVVLASGQATSDVVVYFAEVQEVRLGGLPLIDVKTAYGPLFPYLAALPTFLWSNAMSLIVVAIAMEFVAVLLWLNLSRSFFPELVVRNAAIIYLCSPLSMCNVPITGQNHIWLAVGLVGSLALVARGRVYSSGLVLGFSIVGVKFLSLLFAPPIFLSAMKKKGILGAIVWIVGLLLLPMLCYGVLVYNGLDLSEQVLFHAYYDSSGNIPYFLTILGAYFSDQKARFFANIAGFSTLCLLFVAVWRLGGLKSPARSIFTCSFILVLVLLVSKKAFTSYLLVALFPVCLAAAINAQRRSWLPIAFLIWSLIATVEPTLWFRLMNQSDLSGVVAAPTFTSLSFVIVQVLLLSGYLYLLLLSFAQATMKNKNGIFE